jgi:NAD(P)H-dependent FMN reductase
LEPRHQQVAGLFNFGRTNKCPVISMPFGKRQKLAINGYKEWSFHWYWARGAGLSAATAALRSSRTEDKPGLRRINMPIKLAIILGSTRPGRNGEAVAGWVYEIARQRNDVDVELVDIRDFNLPLLDEPVPPSRGQYSKEHTKAWAAKIESFDAYVFVTPEYNHGPPGALKNAIDYLYREWNNKAAGFVGYGSAGGVRAVEQLRLVMGELQVADVRAQVMLSLFTDFENFSTFKPDQRHEAPVNDMLDQVVAWGGALRTLRNV